MKILLAGDWHSNLHEEPLSRAFESLGYTLIKFKWNSYFNGFIGKIQNKLLFGPQLSNLNQDLLKIVREIQPDLVFIYRGTHIWAETLSSIKILNPRVVIVGYNNDDPFSIRYARSLLWRHFLKGIPQYDICYAYRQHNLSDFLKAGARRVELLRSWFVVESNYPMELSEQDLIKYGSEVTFAGHYEQDGRELLLEAVVESGVQFKLFGPEWDSVANRSKVLKKFVPVYSPRGQEYNKALNGAKIALCFLSKLNRDTYTRRCFEIPATRTLMLAEYTDDLASLFVENKEAVFFRSKSEFVEKIKYYLSHSEARNAIAEAGYKRVHSDGHDVVSRAKQVLASVGHFLG